MSLDLELLINRGDFRLEVELALPVDRVTAVFGPSGSGKTSLLRAIAGLDRHSMGRVQFNQQTWQSGTQFTPVHQRRLAFVFQQPALFPHLNVAQNLDFGSRRSGAVNAELRQQKITNLLAIESLLTRSVEDLSGGEQQRVAIARALCSDPQLLLMDEPMSGLDRAARREILPYIENLNRELAIPIIYVSHALDEVARLADYLALVEPGRVTTAGPIQQMLTRLDLPLAQDEDAESVIDAQVMSHDHDFGLTLLDSMAGQFTVSNMALTVGQHVRLRLAARDISITLERQLGSSILNIFAATVSDLSSSNESQVTVRLDCNGVPVLARVTRRSVSNLNLTPGQPVFIQAKSVAVL